MTLVRLSAAAILSVLGSVSLAQSGTMAEQNFAANAASSDMFEIHSSEIALKKSQNNAVREFAQMMINDHTTASKELKAASQKDGAKVPTKMTEKHAAELKKLNDTPAASFDARYIDAQVAAHREALSLMNSYAKDGDGAALKAHAKKTAPVIQTHLALVQKLNGQM